MISGKKLDQIHRIDNDDDDDDELRRSASSSKSTGKLTSKSKNHIGN